MRLTVFKDIFSPNGFDESHIRRLLYIVITILIVTLCVAECRRMFPPPPPNPAQIDGITTDKTEYSRGDTVTYTVHGYKFLDIPATVIVSLINGESYSIMTYPGNVPPGKLNKTRSFIIPHFIKIGQYQINWTASYHFEGRQDVIRSARSNFFYVNDKQIFGGNK